MTIFLSALLLLLQCGLSQAPDTADPVAVCSAWRAGHAQGTSPQSYRPRPDLLCFVGDIDASSAADFVETLDGSEPTGPVTIVVDSLGGDAEAGITMGEALLSREATVVVDGICASSCANYLFVAADRRVIGPRSMLVFHGGIVELNRDDLRRSLGGQVPEAQVETTIDSLEKQIQQKIQRQDSFLRAADVDVDLFRWMASAFASPRREAGECQIQEADAVVFSDELLAARGVEIHQNEGPTTDAGIADLLRNAGLSKRVCLIDRV